MQTKFQALAAILKIFEILGFFKFFIGFPNESKINFENLSIMQKINDSAFSYNQQVTDLLIFDRND